MLVRQPDVGSAARWVIRRKRLPHDLGAGTGQLDRQLRQLQNRELVGIAEIHGAHEAARPLHHADHAFNQVVAEAERSRLGPVPKDRDVFGRQSLADEIGHHSAVERVHAGAVGVEDPDNANVHAVHAVIVHEQGLRRPLALVVTGARPQRIDAAAVRLRLGVHLGVPINLARRGLENSGPAAACHPQHVDGAHHRGLHRLDGVVLIVPGGGRTGEVVDLVHLQPDGYRDIVPDQLEIRLGQQMGHVALLAGEEIVQADDVVTLRNQPVAQMRTQKSRAAGHQNSFDGTHVGSSSQIALDTNRRS